MCLKPKHLNFFTSGLDWRFKSRSRKVVFRILMLWGGFSWKIGRRILVLKFSFVLPRWFVKAIIMSIFIEFFLKNCDSTLMARWTNFSKDVYSYSSTTFCIYLLNPLTNLATFCWIRALMTPNLHGLLEVWL